MIRRGGHSPEAASWTVAQLGTFFASHRTSFLDQATRRVGNRHIAEELVQDALMKVILAAPELNSDSHALAYIRHTINNLAIDRLRLEGRRPRLVSVDESEFELESWQVPTSDLEEIISAADDAAIIREAISLLSPAERATLVMWEIEGRSAKEIAKELRIKESSVRHTLFRARRSLRKILEEYVVDESKGLTALDLLSNSYSRITRSAKKSSKSILSLVLILFAMVGFNDFSKAYLEQDLVDSPNESQLSLPVSLFNSIEATTESTLTSSVDESDSRQFAEPRGSIAKAKEVQLPGLDSKGVPTGFMTADSSGGIGSLYVPESQSASRNLVSGQVLKTEAGSANILLTQRISNDITGLTYEPSLAYGQEGRWIPLITSVGSLETKRMKGGNYLILANIEVESEAETTMVIPASAGGRDLSSAPIRVMTRILLSPERDRVLAQSLYVVEDGAK
jgi:RNA polymerase sigma factor (sigma-70 family)